ncbi:terminase small subunit [Gemmatimonadota bacterium]
MNTKTSSKARHNRFCQEYLIDLNPAEAYRRSGYRCSLRSAGVCAARLLRKVAIKRRIDELMQQRAERKQITADRVVEEIGRLALLNIKDFMQWDAAGNVKILSSNTMTEAQAAAIAKIKSTRKVYKDKNTGNEVTEHKLEVSFFRKEEMLRLAYRHLGLDSLKDKSNDTKLDELLAKAQKRIKEGKTFFVHSAAKDNSKDKQVNQSR